MISEIPPLLGLGSVPAIHERQGIMTMAALGKTHQPGVLCSAVIWDTLVAGFLVLHRKPCLSVHKPFVVANLDVLGTV